MDKRRRQLLLNKKGFKNFLYNRKRESRKRSRKAGFLRYLKLIRDNSKKLKVSYNPPSFEKNRVYATLGKKPDYNDWINFLIPRYQDFSTRDFLKITNGYLLVPEIFSLSEQNGIEESMYFLKNLFHHLYKQNAPQIILDYKNCKYLDVDASALMDIILVGFIGNFNKCTFKGHNIRVKEIQPINYEKEEVREVLFSIGAYANLRGFKMKDENIISFGFKIGDRERDKEGRLKEIHETQIVDYILDCLAKMNRSLTSEAESHISKVVGEVMANAEEHSDFRYRFAVGYFKKTSNIDTHLGTFKLVIFNFGQTIYESFKRADCPNTAVVQQMKDLSEHYTKKNWFSFGSNQFKEQPLWTLYALQERITSVKDCRRGNGSIRFIDRFFKLKGNDDKDNISKLTLISGNTHIIFDGSYSLDTVEIGKETFKMMTFNKNGNIKELPDEKFVNFAEQFFPGTMISAKICITYNNLETE